MRRPRSSRRRCTSSTCRGATGRSSSAGASGSEGTAHTIWRPSGACENISSRADSSCMPEGRTNERSLTRVPLFWLCSARQRRSVANRGWERRYEADTRSRAVKAAAGSDGGPNSHRGPVPLWGGVERGPVGRHHGPQEAVALLRGPILGLRGGVCGDADVTHRGRRLPPRRTRLRLRPTRHWPPRAPRVTRAWRRRWRRFCRPFGSRP
jgi:hypothetical protein